MNKIREELDILNGRIAAFSKIKNDAVKKADTSHLLADRTDAEKWEKALDELKQERKKKLKQLEVHEMTLAITSLSNIWTLTNHDAPGIYEPHVIETVNGIVREALGLPVTPADQWSHNQPKEPGAPQGTEEQVSDIPPNEPGLPPKGASDTLDLGLTLHQALDILSGDLSYDNVAAVKQILKNVIYFKGA